MFANIVLFLEGIFFGSLLVYIGIGDWTKVFKRVGQVLSHWAILQNLQSVPLVAPDWSRIVESRKDLFLLFSCLSFSSHWDCRLMSLVPAWGIFSYTSVFHKGWACKLAICVRIRWAGWFLPSVTCFPGHSPRARCGGWIHHRVNFTVPLSTCDPGQLK